MKTEKKVSVQYNFRLAIEKSDLQLTAESFGMSITKFVEHVIKLYIDGYKTSVAAFSGTIPEFVSDRQKVIYNLYKLLYTDKKLFIAVCNQEKIFDKDYSDFKIKSLILERYELLNKYLEEFLASIHKTEGGDWQDCDIKKFVDGNIEEYSFPDGSKLQERVISSEGVEDGVKVYRVLGDSVLAWGIKSTICNAYRIQKLPLFFKIK